MYKQRLAILVFFFVLVAAVALLRLVHLQVDQCGHARQEIHDMQILPPQPLPTLRGRIYDRYGRALAKDAPSFYLHASYQITRLLDERFREGKLRRMIRDEVTQEEAQVRFENAYASGHEKLDQILAFARFLKKDRRGELLSQADQINNRIWERGKYIYWRRSHPYSPMDEYREESDTIEPEDVVSIDLSEMHDLYPLVELTGEDLVKAQIELAGVAGVEIRPEGKRIYPYGGAACQVIGWAGPVQGVEKDRFSQDAFLSYLDGELTGKAGIERLCEPLLRGKRGEVQYDKDGYELVRIEPQYGLDVRLTLDIELQKQVEALLEDPQRNPAASQGAGAVVMDSATGDILAVVSTPMFDLNDVRQEYEQIRDDPNFPFISKAIQRNYPPGSTIKPLILIAGLEERKIGAYDTISCPAHPPVGSWPSCLIQWKLSSSHDARWEAEGGNNARNAIRGSCNIYFSRLADRLEERKLQQWLYNFGYGQAVLPGPTIPADLMPLDGSFRASLPQSPGSIILGLQKESYSSFDQVPPIPVRQRAEKRYWGIGQGNLRVTVLQVANALCAIARGGMYKPPRLIIEEDDLHNENSLRNLGISGRTLEVVRGGLFAAVNEPGGTSYRVFHDEQGKKLPILERLKVYGKTGSTQRPEIAWFECFAEDAAGRSLVIAIAVPGGESGAADAAPLGREILQLCFDAGHIGIRKTNPPAAISSPGK